MKRPQLLLLTLGLLQGAVCGCHTTTQPATFSQIPDYALAQPKPRKAIADLEITGARPGVDKAALVQGIRKAMGPASNVYPEQEVMRDAQKLADLVLAGEKVTLRLPPDMAEDMANSLAEAGLIVRLTE